ncbi:hypothetical protein MHI57_24905 [Cytobacillus sp. FSL K6-0129]|uniref:hypothetical protein n=1 Tax=Cytobacillus sp. FSL K6-0129 TaxID=2921421 RepID=UPI0030FBCDD4
MSRISTKDWRNLPIEKWNTTTFHEYLSDRNRELYGVTYQPFGSGSVKERWSVERGQLKNAIIEYGAEVIREYIDICFATHRVNPQYPAMSFGFVYAYKRAELQQAELAVKRKQQRADSLVEAEATEIDEDWF